MNEIPGYDVAAVEAWLSEHAPSIKPPFEWTKLEGGHSNLTYLIVDQTGKKAVIRRPPLGELLPKAHDMSREWALISALAPTPVPVAEAIAFCESPDITGAHFYVMGFVDGRPLYSADDTNELIPEDMRPRFAHSFFDVLADLHAQDPDEIGLGTLGKKGGYIARQVKTWYRSWMASIEPAKMDDPRAHALHDFFMDNLPDEGTSRVVHGDYGVHNCLVGKDYRIAAVVDWEISTLGDPLADLAYALNFWPDPTDREPPTPESATGVPGFPTRNELAQRYADRTGRDLSHLDYYIGFNRWKSAAIVHGVYARYMAGQKSTEGVDLVGLKQSIDRALMLAEEAVGRL